MRFSSRGLDDGFTYPCTKADVREAFGELLASAHLGTRPDHTWSRREVPGKITGRVVLTVSVSKEPWSDPLRQHALLWGYRVRKAEWSDYLHWQIREKMRTDLRPWVEAMLDRPEIAWDKYEQMLLELREGILHVHTRRAK